MQNTITPHRQLTTQRSLVKCKRPWTATSISPPSKVLLEANRVKFVYDACSVQFWVLMLLISAQCVLLPNAYCFQGKVGSGGVLLQPLRSALRQVLSILDQMAAMSPIRGVDAYSIPYTMDDPMSFER